VLSSHVLSFNMHVYVCQLKAGCLTICYLLHYACVITSRCCTTGSTPEAYTPGMLAVCAACRLLQRFEVHGRVKAIFTTPLIAAIGALPRLEVLVLTQGKNMATDATHSCRITALTAPVVVGCLRNLVLSGVGPADEQQALRALGAIRRQLTYNIT
jgi:hypothetical protein